MAVRALHFDFFHTDGEFEVNLPVGEASIVASRGMERTPAAAKVTVEAGKVTVLRLPLSQFTDFGALGWYSGSDHMHMNCGGSLRNTPENLLFMAAAEDLDTIGEKIANKDSRILDRQCYAGPVDKGLSTPERLLSWGQEYRSPFYGHISFINLTKQLISPFTTGARGLRSRASTPATRTCFAWASRRAPSEDTSTRSRAIDIALGTVHYLEVTTSATHGRYAGKVWHRALNCGFRVTASGGEDSITDMHRSWVLGSVRMYAHLGDELTWDGWVEAVRRGRTMVTNGPLVQLRINGELPGAEVRLPSGGGSIGVEARMDTAFPVTRLELVRNGSIAETPSGGRRLVGLHA